MIDTIVAHIGSKENDPNKEWWPLGNLKSYGYYYHKIRNSHYYKVGEILVFPEKPSENGNGYHYYSFEGSLDKFLNGWNEKRTSFKTLQEALKKLADEVDLPVLEATIDRLDFSINVPVERKPKEYISLMDSIPKYGRARQRKPTWLPFNQKSGKKALVFYDKSLEILDKDIHEDKILIPPFSKKGKEIKENNLLRIEYRVLNGASKYLGIPTLGELKKRSNYRKLGKELTDVYQSVYKIESSRFEGVLEYEDIMRFYLREGVIHNGGYQAFEERLESLFREDGEQHKGGIISKQNRRYLLDKFKDAMDNRNTFLRHPLELLELNFKFDYLLKSSVNGNYTAETYPEFEFDIYSGKWDVSKDNDYSPKKKAIKRKRIRKYLH